MGRMMLLGAYLRERKIANVDFASSVNVHKSTIGRVIAGEGCSRKLAHRIETQTCGVVTAAETLAAQSLPEASSPRAA